MASNVRFLTIGEPQDHIRHRGRNAVRCIIARGHDICLIYIQEGNYYKLSGGGVKSKDSSDIHAVKREALEETGCEVRVISNVLAKTQEYRSTLKQNSNAYICELVNDTGAPLPTEVEASEGLGHLWCPAEEALERMKANEPAPELGRFIKKWDKFLLEVYSSCLAPQQNLSELCR